MRKSTKSKSHRSIKLPDYLNRNDYEPKPSIKQELDSIWDGVSVPPDNKTGER